MAVIIGAGTTVVSDQFPSAIASISFGFQPSVTRLYQLGSFAPYDTNVQKTRTIQLTLYGRRADGSGGSVEYDITPSISCVDVGGIEITVNPASCVGTLLPFTETYYLNSYSYQKDNLGTGQESWSLTSRPDIPGYTGEIVLLRGPAEGTITTGVGAMTPADMGIVIDETGSNDAFGAPIEGESGSVSAGSPGVGNYDVTRYILATAVGSSLG
jgi:hypothetical protein